MGYVDLIPDVFRLTMPDLATGKSYHTQKFNVGNKQCIGVTIKASQALSVAVAYGIATDTAAAAGVDIAASLPYKTSATSFASNTSTEGGTYHEIAVPPHARQAQLVISNASGSTVSGAVIDAALRVVAYPAASGSGRLPNTHIYIANKTSGQAISNNSTPFTFDAPATNTGAWTRTNSTTVTCNIAGRYLVRYGVIQVGNSANCDMFAKANGSGMSPYSQKNQAQYGVGNFNVRDFAVGDTVAVFFNTQTASITPDTYNNSGLYIYGLGVL